jgi:hypothetical protein
MVDEGTNKNWDNDFGYVYDSNYKNSISQF